MDYSVLMIVGLTFVFFLVFHTLYFRSLSNIHKTRDIAKTFLFSWALAITFIQFYLLFYWHNPELSIISVVLFTLMSLCYFFVVFMIIYSSVHLQLVEVIQNSELKGFDRVQQRKFFKNMIVQKRLQQLQSMGLIIRTKGGLSYIGKSKIINVREGIGTFIEKLFP